MYIYIYVYTHIHIYILLEYLSLNVCMYVCMYVRGYISRAPGARLRAWCSGDPILWSLPVERQISLGVANMVVDTTVYFYADTHPNRALL